MLSQVDLPRGVPEPRTSRCRRPSKVEAMSADRVFAARNTAWARLVAAVFVASAAFLMIDSVLNGDWVQLMSVVLVAGSAGSWWMDNRRRMLGRERRTTPLTLAWQALVTIYLLAAGILVLALKDSVILRTAGAILVIASVCGVFALYFSTRSYRENSE